MEFLCDEWLVDVATDYTGKAPSIAAALTLIERSLLTGPAVLLRHRRPARQRQDHDAHHADHGRHRGLWPAAAAWSSNEEERRKALMSHFLLGMPYILWDNIPRGLQISCPHIERSCTSAYYSDRQLGVSEMVRTAASTIHFFTGNNIGAKGDLASRSLHIRLSTSIAPTPRTGRSSTRTRSAGPRTTAPRSWRRSTPSCSAIRSSRRRATPRARPGSRCGGDWSARRSSTLPG